MAKYIKGKDGKFKGSIGDGKTRVPTAGQTPAALKAALDSVQQVTYGRLPFPAPTITLPYDPNAEANRVLYAMGKGGSFSERRERKKMRKELEAMFGQIDWSSTEPVSAEPFVPAAPTLTEPVPHATPVTEIAPKREQGTEKRMLEILDGQRGTLWLRGKDEKFYRAGENVRMLFMKAGSHGTAKDSEWYTKEHVLIQYGGYAERYDIDDVSFSATQR